MHIIATGSREFKDYATVTRAFVVALDDLTYKFPEDKTIVVRQGNCPTGADQLVKEFVNKAQPLLRGRGFAISYMDYNPDWKQFGKFAGPKRNKQMVDDGAELVLAFLQKGELNKGTRSTIKFAKEAGIDVREYWNVS